MTHQHDSRDELRATHFPQDLGEAKHSAPTGSTGVFLRVTLTIIFMYLMVISHSISGATGAVFVSILFLVALFVPVFYHGIKAILVQRRAQAEWINSDPAAEIQQQV